MKRTYLWIAYDDNGEITDYFKEEDTAEAFYVLYTSHRRTVILRKVAVYIEEGVTLAAQMLKSRFKEWLNYVSKDDLINNIGFSDLELPILANFAKSKGDHKTANEVIRHKENTEKRYEETMKRICGQEEQV